MKKHILSLFLLGLFSANAFSQAQIIPPTQSMEYEIMKKDGKIPSDITISNTHDFAPSAEDLEKFAEMQGRGGSAGGACSCYIPPDATYTLAMAPNDDGSTALLTIPFSFCLYGTNYTTLYINNNGNISFGTPYGTFSSSPFPDPSYVMVAPFWGDVDTRGTGTVQYKITPTAMYINWEAVGYYSSMTDKINTFQLIITDGTDPVLPGGNNIAFCYGDMQWTTGAASSGVGGFGGVPSTVGVNKGDGINYLQLGRFDQPGTAYDGGYGANDGVSWLDFKSFYFNVCSSTNIPPIPTGVNQCGDTIRVCGFGDTIISNILFLSPEISETTTVTVSAPGVTGFSVLATTAGNPGSATFQLIADASNAGINHIILTGTDNGTPAGTTVLDYYIYVDTAGLSAFNPVITGAEAICSGSSTTLSVSPAIWDSYLWSDGTSGSSLTISDTGLYFVTITWNGCSKSEAFYVDHQPAPTPVITGTPVICTGITSTLTVDSLIYTAYSWSNGSSNDSVAVGSGSYTVTVTDTNGCTAASPPFVVVVNPPFLTPVILGDNLTCGAEVSTLTVDSAYTTYSWAPGGLTTGSLTVSSGTYTVTVSDSNGCTGVSPPFTVTNFNSPVTITGDFDFCPGDSATLLASPLIPAGASYAWSNAATTQSQSVSAGGTYSVTVSYPNGCSFADTVDVVENPVPVAFYTSSPLSPSNPGTTISFIDLSTISGGSISSWFWNFGDSTNSNSLLQNPFYAYAQDGTYPVTLIVTSNMGCSDTVSFPYLVITDIEVPNIFTPNGDQVNDLLVFKNLEYYPGSSLTVFNRWGNKIFEAVDYKNNWSGDGHEDGVYFFILEGTLLKNTKTGFVQILR